MSKFKVGDTVEIIVNERALRNFYCSRNIVTGGVFIKSTSHANSLLRGDTGWLQQYNNGGWDTSNAVAFKRTVEITGVL